jgi:hypothetical protein
MRRHHWLAAAIFAGLGGIGLLVLADTWFDQRAALESTRARIAELRARRLDPRDVEAIKRMLAAPPDPRSGLLAGRGNEAVPHLETLLRSALREHKTELISLSLAEGTTADKLPVVRGNLHLAVDDENIGSLLRALEAGSPTVFWERLQISYRSAERGDPDLARLDLAASILVYRDIPFTERPAP